MGILGVIIPEEYGGVGIDTLTYALVVEELAQVCGCHGLTVRGAQQPRLRPIVALRHARRRSGASGCPALPPASTCSRFGLTEAGAGSDAGGTRTTAVRDGDGWVVNGSKMWITNAHQAGAVIAHRQ